MSIKHSIALKKRWARSAPEDRSRAMSVLARRKQKLLSDKEKQKHAFTMVKAKEKKRVLIAKKKK